MHFVQLGWLSRVDGSNASCSPQDGISDLFEGVRYVIKSKRHARRVSSKEKRRLRFIHVLARQVREGDLTNPGEWWIRSARGSYRLGNFIMCLRSRRSRSASSYPMPYSCINAKQPPPVALTRYPGSVPVSHEDLVYTVYRLFASDHGLDRCNKLM